MDPAKWGTYSAILKEKVWSITDDLWWMTGRKMHEMQCFCRLLVSVHVKDRSNFESIASVREM